MSSIPRIANASSPHWQNPAQPTRLIGRDRDVERVSSALLQPDCRLLTILGTAGVGKTRLAVGVAESVADRFADGVGFIDLTQITDPAAFPWSLATELGLEEAEGAALSRLEEYLSDREMLLVLDNFEHILPAALALAGILATCPHIKMLATSREPLRLRWERRLTLDPLEVPSLELPLSPEDLRAVPSVALFLERALAADLRFEASDEILHQIAELCARLEGLPLAIELAAARINVLSPATMLERFDTVIQSLHQYGADVPERHRSIHVALEESYRPLSPVEQTAFRGVSVFYGGWTVEGFKAVVAEGLGDADALTILASLTDKALVTSWITPEGVMRFRMLDAIRSYALSLLEEAGEMPSAMTAHALYYLSVAEREAAPIRAGGPFVFSLSTETAAPEDRRGPRWPASLDRELANLRAALQWANESGDNRVLLRLAAALRRYWWIRGLLDEGTRWLQLALDLNSDAGPDLRSQALTGLGIMHRQQGDLELARTSLEEALALTEETGNTRLLAILLIELATVRRSLQQIPEVIPLLEESVRLSRADGEHWLTAAALAVLGMADMLLDRHQTAEARLTESLVVFQAAGDRRSVVIVSMLLAYVFWWQDDASRALPLLDDILQQGRQFLPDVTVGEVVEIAAIVLSRVTAPDVAARLLGAGDRHWARGLRRTTLQAFMHERGYAALSQQLGPQRLDAAIQEGRKLSIEQAMDEARAIVETALAEGSSAGDRDGPDSLSKRELEVLALLAQGYINKEIGQRLGISENTAKFHVTSIRKKLGVESRVEAVTEAVRRRLV